MKIRLALISIALCELSGYGFEHLYGVDLGSLVSRDYAERRPFKLDGKIGTVKVELK